MIQLRQFPWQTIIGLEMSTWCEVVQGYRREDVIFLSWGKDFPVFQWMWTKEHFAELLLVVVLCPWRKWLMDKTDTLQMTEWRDSYKMDLWQYHWTTASWVSTSYTFHHKNYELNISLKIFVLKFNYIKAMVVKKS